MTAMPVSASDSVSNVLYDMGRRILLATGISAFGAGVLVAAAGLMGF
jgi:hypothetical protein